MTVVVRANEAQENLGLSTDRTKRIFRFAVIGGAATAAHLAAAALVVYSFPSIQIFNANALAFLFAVVVSFVGHSVFTFRTRGSLSKFLATALIGLLCNNIVAYGVLWLTSNKLLSVAIGTCAAPVVVYILSALWVFEKKIEK